MKDLSATVRMRRDDVVVDVGPYWFLVAQDDDGYLVSAHEGPAMADWELGDQSEDPPPALATFSVPTELWDVADGMGPDVILGYVASCEDSLRVFDGVLAEAPRPTDQLAVAVGQARESLRNLQYWLDQIRIGMEESND